MPVVLGKGPDPGEPIEGAAALVSMQPAELGPADREVSVGSLSGREEVAMARAVHGLHAEFLFVVGTLKPVHIVVKFFVMARALEKLAAEELGRDDLFVAITGIEIPHKIAEPVVERHAFGQIEGSAGREHRVEHEEPEFRTHPPMIALARLLEAGQVLAELLLARIGGAVDSLELGPGFVTAEIGTRNLQQRGGADLPRMLHVRAAAKVDEVAVLKETDLLAIGDIPQSREFEFFALFGE